MELVATAEAAERTCVTMPCLLAILSMVVMPNTRLPIIGIVSAFLMATVDARLRL